MFRRIATAGFFALAGVGMPRAEIVTDGTLGPAQSIPGPDYAIGSGLGQIHGGNLFHSFSRFGLSSSESATFSGPGSIDNILARVTGGETSLIDGTLRSSIANANLFFVNPAGVVFGPNARLDISGSFHATTADYLRFQDNARFSATDPGSSTLTSAEPAAFGFLTSQASEIRFDRAELAVGPGESVSVIGGPISFESDNPDAFSIEARSGVIRVVSVGSPGEVSLDPAGSSIDVSQISDFGDIRSEGGDLSTRGEVGEAGGTIVIRGGNLVMRDAVYTSGNQSAQDHRGLGIDIELSGELTLGGGTVSQINSSACSTGNASSCGAGKAGDIHIRAGRLIISGDGDDWTGPTGVGSRAFGAGDAGNILIEADAIYVNNAGVIANDTELGGSGDAGDTTIVANTIEIQGDGSADYQDYARISSATFNTGNAGNVTIRADRMDVIGGSDTFVGVTTQVGPEASGAAEGGDIHLEVKHLEVRNGAQISASTFAGSGDAGDISVVADSLVLTGESRDGAPAGLFGESVYKFLPSGDLVIPEGDAGDISIHARTIEVSDGAQISSYSESYGSSSRIDIDTQGLEVARGGQVTSTSFGFGSAGKIGIKAAEIQLKGPTPSLIRGRNEFTGIFSIGGIIATDAGDVTIDTGLLNIADGAQINAKTFGGGDGGDIRISAVEMGLSGTDVDRDQRAQISSETSINLDYPNLGTGNGGNVSIDTRTLRMSDQARITASSSSHGRGGDVTITAGRIQMASGSEINATSSLDGDAGNIDITVDDSLKMVDSAIRTSARSADGGNIRIRAINLLSLRDSQITTSVAGGAGHGGNINIDPIFVILDNSQIIAKAIGGDGGNIRIRADHYFKSPDSVVDASSTFGFDGTVEIDAPESDQSEDLESLPSVPLDQGRLIRDRCSAGRVRKLSSLVVVPRDGLVQSSGDTMPSSYSRYLGSDPNSAETAEPPMLAMSDCPR